MRCDDEDKYVIQTVMGKKYRVEKSDVKTVDELKLRLEELSGIPSEKQIIIVNTAVVKSNFPLQNVFFDDYVCILGQQADQKDEIESKYRNRLPKVHINHKRKGQEEKPCHYHESLQERDRKSSEIIGFRPEKGLNKQVSVRKKLENLVDKRKIKQMMEMGYSQQRSIKSLRACMNQFDKALDYLQKEHINRKATEQSEVTSSSQDIQRYLASLLQKPGLLNRQNIENKQHFYLIAASTKQINPELYELIVQNMDFLELKINQFLEKKTQLPQQSDIESKEEIGEVQTLYSFKDCKAGSKVTILQKPKSKESQLASAKVINISNKSNFAPSLLLNTQKNKDSILQAILCSPAWNKIRQELIKHNDKKFITYYINKLKNSNPIFQILIRKENESSIASLLFGVKVSKQKIYKHPTNEPLSIGAKRSQKDKEKMDAYYCSLVDQALVDILVSKRVDADTAVVALRANKNHIYYAAENIMMGGVFKKPTWKFKKESEQANYLREKIILQHYYCNTKDEFNILVASWKQIDPTLYEIVLRYEGAFEFCSPNLTEDSYLLNQIIKSRESYKKKFIKQKGSLEQYYKEAKARILMKR